MRKEVVRQFQPGARTTSPVSRLYVHNPFARNTGERSLAGPLLAAHHLELLHPAAFNGLTNINVAF
jgi:hypothetical protein